MTPKSRLYDSLKAEMLV